MNKKRKEAEADTTTKTAVAERTRTQAPHTPHAQEPHKLHGTMPEKSIANLGIFGEAAERCERRQRPVRPRRRGLARKAVLGFAPHRTSIPSLPRNVNKAALIGQVSEPAHVPPDRAPQDQTNLGQTRIDANFC